MTASADERATAETLTRFGTWLAAVDGLTEANRDVRDATIEAQLVQARHRAFTELARQGPETWPTPAADLFASVAGIPEISSADLSVATLGAGLQHHGSLLVRGLIPRATCAMLTEEIRRAFRGAEAAGAGESQPDDPPAYVPFEPDEGYDFGFIERQFYRFGAVLAVEAPRALFEVIEALKLARVDRVIGEYFGEAPALSAKKTSLRRAQPDSPAEWHQDGAFLGSATHTVNVWTALTPCGHDAPSLDVFARPFATTVPTGTDGAPYDWSVGQAEAARAGLDDVVHPDFDAGDALFFNQLTLHRTGVAPGMTRDRYALEAWCFAPSTYPFEQVPILF